MTETNEITLNHVYAEDAQKGSFGVISQQYRNEPVYLKVYPKLKLIDELKWTQEFGRLFNTITRYDNLVQYFAYKTNEHNHYVAVAAYDICGGTLRDQISYRHQAKVHWTEIELLCAFQSLLNAVDYLHMCRIIHRNIMPENIFYGRDYRLRIADYFESKLVKGIYGYNGYSAPELHLKRPFFNEKTDVWSLGLIFHEMCELQYPFHNRDRSEHVTYISRYSTQLNDIVGKMVKWRNEKRAEVPKLIRKIIQSSVFKDEEENLRQQKSPGMLQCPSPPITEADVPAGHYNSYTPGMIGLSYTLPLPYARIGTY